MAVAAAAPARCPLALPTHAVTPVPKAGGAAGERGEGARCRRRGCVRGAGGWVPTPLVCSPRGAEQHRTRLPVLSLKCGERRVERQLLARKAVIVVFSCCIQPGRGECCSHERFPWLRVAAKRRVCPAVSPARWYGVGRGAYWVFILIPNKYYIS